MAQGSGMDDDGKPGQGQVESKGRFLFVNKTSNLTNNSVDNFTIASHVSRTHRRWLKEERSRKLYMSSGQVLTQRSLLPTTLDPCATSQSTSAPFIDHEAGSREIESNQHFRDTNMLHKAINTNAVASHSRETGPSVYRSDAVYPFKYSQEKADQQRAAKSGKRNSKGLPRLVHFKGNSDPFSAAAIVLTAYEHEILHHAQRFFVFVANPSSKNAVWRSPIADATSSRIELRNTIADGGETHAILAAGYAVQAQDASHDDDHSITKGLYHRTKAVIILRDRLLKHGFSPAVTTLIRLLISLDFQASDNESALVHLRGLWAMAATTPTILLDAQELLRVSDAWISISLLKSPEISPQRYDPGARLLQGFDRTLRSLEKSLHLDTADVVHQIAHRESALSVDMWRLLASAQEVVNTKSIIDKIDDTNMLQEVVQWLNKRSSAVTGYCTGGYADNMGAPGSPKPGKRKVDSVRILAAATCLCSMMFMNFKFLDLPTNYNFSKTCQKIELVLRSLSAEHASLGRSEKNDYLWLTFVSAMGNDIFGARGDIPYSNWSAREFHRISAELELDDEGTIWTCLGRYPHYQEMDVFLEELLSQIVPLTHIIQWSKWKIILNHA